MKMSGLKEKVGTDSIRRNEAVRCSRGKHPLRVELEQREICSRSSKNRKNIGNQNVVEWKIITIPAKIKQIECSTLRKIVGSC